MMHVLKITYLSIFLCAYALAENNVQNLINSGDINNCYLGNNMLQLTDKGLQSIRGIENVLGAADITIIDLSNNQISNLNECSFEHFPKLEQLILNHNQLEDIAHLNDIPGLTHVRELHLTHNRLQNFGVHQLNNFPMLYVLNLGFNQIKIVEPQHGEVLPNLEMLFLNNNHIRTLPSYAFVACPNLQALYVQDNYLEELQGNCFAGLANVRLLYLQNNRLKKLTSSIFADLHKVHLLYLGNNQIQHLEKNWHKGLDRIKILDITHNKLIREKASQAEIDYFLSIVRPDIYQDIVVDGVTIKEGVKDCEIRWPNIKKILDQYKRPFTVLDIGASEGYFSLRIAAEYPESTCVMIEGDKTLLLPQICALNKKLTNVVVLEKFITPQDLKELGACEHFDFVIAFNVVHQLKDDWKEGIDHLLTLGDHILIETPPAGCRTSANKENLPFIEEYLAKNSCGKVIGQVPRYGRPGLPSPEQKYSNVYLFNMHKNVLPKPTWGSPNLRFYAINSTFEHKTLYKPRINKTMSWKPGINLWTFKNLHGVYPAQDIIQQEIKELAVFDHGDFLPWNMIIQGNNLELIDWEDNNSPDNMHNYDACWTQFLSD